MADVAPFRLMHVDDDGQQKLLGSVKPQLWYELGQEAEVRGKSSNGSNAWHGRRTMKSKTSRPDPRLAMSTVNPAISPDVVGAV